MLRRLPNTLIITALAATIGVAVAQPGDGNNAPANRTFDKGHPFTVDDLPPGRTREKLESLPEPARRRAMERLHSFEFPAKDVDTLIVTDGGGVLYADPVPPELPTETEPLPDDEETLPQPGAKQGVRILGRESVRSCGHLGDQKT